jgi:hypothetical protein
MDNPLVDSIYEATRPIIDGALVGACAPQRFGGAQGSANAKKVVRPVKSVVKSLVKTNRKKARGTRGASPSIEILDAEFVDVPNEANR